jgi:hypothetical protein
MIKTPLFLSHYDVHSAKLGDLKAEAQVLCRVVHWVHPFSDRLAPGGHTKVIGEHEIPIGDDVVYFLNLPGEVDGSRVAAANDDGDALAGRRAVTLREQGCEGCCSSRLGDNAQHGP